MPARPALERLYERVREAKKVLEAHAGPGNLREMNHVLRYALSLCDDRVILPEHLPEAFGGAAIHTPSDLKTERARLEALLEENGCLSILRQVLNTVIID